MSENRSTSGGVGATTVLLIVFVVLKLTDNIQWSWWWVLSPAWLSVVVGIVLFLLVSVIRIGASPFDSSRISDRERRSVQKLMDKIDK